MQNAYATLSDVKQRLRIADTVDDGLLSELIEGASRTIDSRCGRKFWADPAPVTRFYRASTDAAYMALLSNPFLERKSWSRFPLPVGDLLSVTALETNDSGDRTSFVTWDPTLDYYLEPVNAAVDMIPYSRIRPDPLSGRYWFPPWPQGVKVTGIWGYAFDWDGDGVPEAPEPIREATVLLTIRLYKRKDAPFGVVEAGAMEKMAIRLKEDQDIESLIAPYMYNVGERSTNWVVIT